MKYCLSFQAALSSSKSIFQPDGQKKRSPWEMKMYIHV